MSRLALCGFAGVSIDELTYVRFNEGGVWWSRGIVGIAVSSFSMRQFACDFLLLLISVVSTCTAREPVGWMPS